MENRPRRLLKASPQAKACHVIPHDPQPVQGWLKYSLFIEDSLRTLRRRCSNTI